MNLLYPYQMEAAVNLRTSLAKYGGALDASDTGTGKTFTALGVAALRGIAPLVVCPKAVKTSWRKAAEFLNVPILDVCNIEQLKTGKTPYLKRAAKGKFVWKLPRGSLLIYDEVQGASGYKSQNGKVLALTKAYGIETLCLSATVADSPLKMRAIGYLLGLHKFRDHYSWCLKYGCYQNSWGGLAFVKGNHRLDHLKKIHEQIFPAKGQRVRIADLPDFPENATFVEAYDLGGYTKEIDEIYAEMEEEILNPDSDQSPLTLMLRASQKSERCKVPLLMDMTEDLLDEGKSVVIFVSFRETMDSLCEKFPEASIIIGGQKEADRDNEIEKFQQDLNRVALVMIQAGGVGVSLHDTHGKHPRVSLITPNFSAEKMKQALGRIHRAGAKSKSIQRILYAAGTVEESACKAVRKKLDNLDMLNDGDLAGDFIDILKK